MLFEPTRPSRLLLWGSLQHREEVAAAGLPVIVLTETSSLTAAQLRPGDVVVIDVSEGQAPVWPANAGGFSLAACLVLGSRDDPVTAAALAQHLGADDTLLVPAALEDITRRVRLLAEMAHLRRAVYIAEASLDVRVDGVSFADATEPGFPLVYVSRTFEQLTGYRKEECLGRSCRFLQGEGTDPAAIEKIRHALQTETETHVRLKNYRRNGTFFWNELTLVPLRDPSGQVCYVAGLQHDVTDLVEARAELELAHQSLATREQFIRDVLNMLQAAVVAADHEDRISFANEAAHETLRLGSDCLGAPVWSTLQVPPARQQQAQGNASEQRFIYTFHHADGETLDLGLSVRADERGKSHDVTRVFLFRDIAPLRHHDRQERRRERLEALGTMVAGFAHEVRNPIASIRLLVEALSAELPSPHPQREYVDRLLHQAERIERLVKTMLRFGRPEPLRRALHHPFTVLNGAVEGVLHRTGGQRVTIFMPADLPYLFCDYEQLIQVLVILLNNALDVVSDPSDVALEVSLVPQEPDTQLSRMCIAVIDHGPGIAPSLRAQIFDPFFTTKPHGVGLGLSIAQHIVQEHEGQLECLSSSKSGTRFEMLLPIGTS